MHNLFQQDFYRYYQPLCQYANTLLKDAPASEDIVQEVFMRVWEKKQELIGKKELELYLFAAVRNNCLTWISKHNKARITPFTEDETEHVQTDYEEQPVSGKEYDELLKDAVRDLPPKCREIFVMSRVSELTYKGIADLLGISVKTVENQMGKALRILRSQVRKKRPFLLPLLLFFH